MVRVGQFGILRKRTVKPVAGIIWIPIYGHYLSDSKVKLFNVQTKGTCVCVSVSVYVLHTIAWSNMLLLGHQHAKAIV